MKRTGVTKYSTLLKALGITALTGTLVAGVMQVQAHASERTGASSTPAFAAATSLSASSIQRAEKKLEELTGKSLTLGKATNFPSGSILAVQGASGGEVLLNKKGEIDSISVKMKWSDLSASHQEAMQKALDTVFPEGSAQAEHVTLFMNYTDINPKVKNKLQMTAEVQNTTINVLDGKLSMALKILKIQDVPEAAIKSAKAVIAKVEHVKKAEALTQAFLITEPNAVKYELRFGAPTSKYPVSVDIDKKTNKATGLYLGFLQDNLANKSDAQINKVMQTMKNADMNKLKKTAVPQIKKWLGMDLSGYKLTKVANEPGNAIFTKSGAASVEITYNSKGEVYWVN